MLSLDEIISIITLIIFFIFFITFLIYDFRLSKKPCDPRFREVDYLRTLSIQEVNWVAKFSMNNPAAEQVLLEKKKQLHQNSES